MSIVTLTTDFGLQDYYVAVIKGAMLCQNSHLNIIDVTHNIKTYDIVQAAFVLRNTYQSFPKGTIHIVSVNNCYDENAIFVAIVQDGHFFIGPDNGVFSLIFDKMPVEIYQLPHQYHQGSFPLKELFAYAVGHLTRGGIIQTIGTPLHEITERINLQPVTGANYIRGAIIHIDNYENVITNINLSLFERICKGRNFALFFKRNDSLSQLSVNYSDVPLGETLCLFNSANYLEIAINMGKAASMLGLKLEDNVQLDFY